ncbi:hypothetical protein D3C87_1682020 [compost metagenome]
MTRSGDVYRYFIDGVLQATTTASGNMDNGAAISYAIGTRNGTFKGYIDELRITKGVARYTTNFTVPTLPFPNR